MTVPARAVIVIMGVSACGKTVVGRALAERLGGRFVDGDDHHPAANVAKMAAGSPLVDADRWPWLDRLHAILAEHLAADSPAPLVVACSALARRYRDRLRGGLPLERFRFVHLAADFDTILAGFEPADLEGLLNPGGDDDDQDDDDRHDKELDKSDVTVAVGLYRFRITQDEFIAWCDRVKQDAGFDKESVLNEIRSRLGL